MTLRQYLPADCAALAALFYDTVHTVNAADYTPAQLDAWATGSVDLAAWNRSFLAHDTRIAAENGTILGFGDMDDMGMLDRLYVRADAQRRGIATALLGSLEQWATTMHGVSRFRTYASITAKPFFKKRGYRVLRENTVLRQGICLSNFYMEKSASVLAGVPIPTPS